MTEEQMREVLTRLLVTLLCGENYAPEVKPVADQGYPQGHELNA